MTHRARWSLLMMLALLAVGCGPGTKESTLPAERLASKEELYREGNLLYLQRQFDTAAVLLTRAYALDTTYADAALALASLYFDLGKAETAGSRKANDHFRQSFRYYRRVEESGNHDDTVLDRLCEVSMLLDDDRSFVRYAKQNAELYPYERQRFNLGLAYLNAAEYQSVIKTQKEAIDKHKSSAYLGGYYRLLGMAYVKLDRDQTAEKTFVAGLKAVDARLAEIRRSERPAAEDITRLSADRVGMLVHLRRIYQIYKKQDDLERVERQLKDAGYTK